MIIDGKRIANEILEGLHGNFSLGIIMDSDKAVNSFVRMKERVAKQVGVHVRRFSAEEFDQALLCDGVIVQLPITNAEALLAKIPPQKDVDALGANPLVRAPVAEAVREILTRANVEVKNKKAVVVGAGKLVGIPCAKLLQELGAKVVVVTLEQRSLEELSDADIVVLGVGNPGIIKPDMLKQDVVLIDAGTSETAGKLSGDADPLCAEVASVFTPVPGGIGPIAVAMIFKNLFILSQKKPLQ